MKLKEISLSIALAVLLGVGSPRLAHAQMDSNVQMALGNPSSAMSDMQHRDNYLIKKPQYAMSYNSTGGRPNWVSWHVSKEDLGPESRGNFAPDLTLPQEFYQVVPNDYKRSGYDRGHNCPSGDRTANREDNDATFLMSNMMPQAPGNNQGPWAKLEDYTRSLVNKGNEVYVICGGGGSSGTLKNGKVTIPAFTWKVIVVLPNRTGNDVKRINADTRVIAVRMPNISTIRKKNWKTFRVKARDIEQATGYNFLSNVPQDIQDAIENRLDNQ